MGKTYKDKANYYRFKQIEDEAPSHIKEKIDVMNTHHKGYRSGDNRKSDAKTKVHGRRSRRMQEKQNHDATIPFSTTLK